MKRLATLAKTNSNISQAGRLGSLAKVGAAAESWWLSGGISAANCIAAYQPKGAASYAASKVNLANPGTYNASEGVEPEWDNTEGWKFTVAGMRLATGLTPSASTWSYIMRVKADTNGIDTEYGRAFESVNDLLIIPLATTKNSLFMNNFVQFVVFLGSTDDVVVGMANRGAYLNGSPVGTMPSPTTSTSGALIIGNRSDGNRTLDGKIRSFAIYNATLTAAQVLAVSTAMAAL